MAAKLRHWKEKGGRFWARIAVPASLRPDFGGKSELIEPLGGDRRLAERNHPAAVARLMAKLEGARQKNAPNPVSHVEPTPPQLPALSADQIRELAWLHYTTQKTRMNEVRKALPSRETADTLERALLLKIETGELPDDEEAPAFINARGEVEMMRLAREWDTKHKERRLALIRAAVVDGDFRCLRDVLDGLAMQHGFSVGQRLVSRRDLELALARAEIAALEETLDHDQGKFATTTADELIRPPAAKAADEPVPLMELFRAYIAARQKLGKHRDAGAGWLPCFRHLIAFLGHDDARGVSRRNLLDWRDALLAEGISAKTIANKHLASVRAVLRWAFENDRLPTNEAATVRQQAPRRALGRERGFTTPEAIRILQCSLNYLPEARSVASRTESTHIASAKRWCPLLWAVTGARTTEITQLRKEDLRCEGDVWVIRITPAAGSVKTGVYRDVPLHRQVVALGFVDFVKAAPEGPLFHLGKSPQQMKSGSEATAARVTKWLRGLGVVPDDVQPSYGWRHRFKTVGRELGASTHVHDAIQGHAGRTAIDDRGDVTVAAKVKVIEMLPDYELSGLLAANPPRSP